MDLAIDRPHLANDDICHFEPRSPRSLRRPPEDLRRLATNDQQNGLVRRRLGDHPLPRNAAVPEDDHAVADFEHLIESMRHVNHADAVPAQPPQSPEQPRNLVRRQAGGGLVEHQDFGVSGERARDRDDRFLCARQILDTQIGMDVCAELGQRSSRPRASRGPIDHAEAARIPQCQADILGDGHPFDQAEILMNERNGHSPNRMCMALSVVGNTALVERVNAGEDLDERRLAGTVLVQQRQNLASADRQTNITERLGAAETLGDVANLKQGTPSSCRIAVGMSSHPSSLRFYRYGKNGLTGVMLSIRI
jgi:hypothetical protein